jgi:hypothetical protein
MVIRLRTSTTLIFDSDSYQTRELVNHCMTIVKRDTKKHCSLPVSKRKWVTNAIKNRIYDHKNVHLKHALIYFE